MLCVSLVASAASLAPGHRAAPGSCTLRVSKQQTIQSLRRQLVARAEEGKSSGAPAAADTPNDEVAAEQLLRRRKGSKADSKAAGSGGSAKQQPPKVISAVRDQVYGGGPLTFEQQAENSVVSLLAVIFFVILAEGVFLAGSGFMPDWLDQFAQDIVFPAFSPTLLLFLAISSAYGVWKTRAGPEEEK